MEGQELYQSEQEAIWSIRNSPHIIYLESPVISHDLYSREVMIQTRQYKFAMRTAFVGTPECVKLLRSLDNFGIEYSMTVESDGY